MARTQLTLSGRVDAAAITALKRAIDGAQRQGYEVSLDVTGSSPSRARRATT